MSCLHAPCTQAGLPRRRFGSIKRAMDASGQEQRGMVLPFQQLSLTFQDLSYRCAPSSCIALIMLRVA